MAWLSNSQSEEMIRFIKNILDIKNLLGKQRGAEEYIKFICNRTNPQVTMNGSAMIHSVKNGYPHTDTISGTPGTLQIISIQADANTPIIISGSVTKFECASIHVVSLDVSQKPDLVLLNCAQNEITELNLRNNVALTSLYTELTDLTELDISQNVNLTDGFLETPTLAVIRCRALNMSFANKIANAITASLVNDGVLYANSADPYYSIVQIAATSKGWSILPL